MTNTASRYSVPESELTTYLIEDRRASLSPYGKGNSKLGNGIFTYSKLPVSTCPGASEECLAICYARKIEHTNKEVWNLWKRNSERGDTFPPIPSQAEIIRFHVSGDFDTVKYIESWIDMAKENPDVIFYGYTRSWRINELNERLKKFMELTNVYLWASIDISIETLPEQQWRRAWIEGDSRLKRISERTYKTFDGRKAIICPEEAGVLPNCQSCRFCFRQHDMDLVFLKH